MVRNLNEEQGKATVVIDGVSIEVPAPQPFSVVTRLAQERGLSKVAVYIDGKPSLSQADDPPFLTPNMEVIVRRDDGGGAR
jgi:hypothetical protein